MCIHKYSNTYMRKRKPARLDEKQLGRNIIRHEQRTIKDIQSIQRIKIYMLTTVRAMKGIHPMDMVMRTKMTIRVHEGHSNFPVLAVSWKKVFLNENVCNY